MFATKIIYRQKMIVIMKEIYLNYKQLDTQLKMK